MAGLRLGLVRWPAGGAPRLISVHGGHGAAGDMMVMGCLLAGVRLLNLGWLPGQRWSRAGRQQGFGSQPQVIS